MTNTETTVYDNKQLREDFIKINFERVEYEPELNIKEQDVINSLLTYEINKSDKRYKEFVKMAKKFITFIDKYCPYDIIGVDRA